ncbi:MAG: hypothetical protein AMXMBFR46_00030 [Acidimicrobiia bacterium]
MTLAAPVEPHRARLPEPIDWALAGRVARRVAGRDPLARSYLASSLAPDFVAVSAQAETLVADFTGLHSGSPVRAMVLDRAAWVDANVASMRGLLAPLTDRVGERLARSPLAPVGRTVTATELGVLLGWFSQRVLGQYDLLVPGQDTDAGERPGDAGERGGDAPGGSSGDRGGDDDAVYYVGANVLALEKRFAFRPRDFRLWIALHECTHRAQFTGVPWLRPYFLSLVSELLGAIDPDPKRVVHALRAALEELRRGRNPLDDGGLVALLATPEHRGTIGRIQSLMTLLEGHGNRVMNELGARHGHGLVRMGRIREPRRRSTGLTGLFHKLVGLEAKLRQYEVGEAFVAGIEAKAGPRAIDAAWQGPEWLPTADELEHPDRWLARAA